MPVSHCRYGVKRVGFIPMIRADGSNGIVATILGGACQKRTLGRLDAGKLFAATSYKSDAIVTQAIRGADHDSDKPCCTGPMIAGRSEWPSNCCHSSLLTKKGRAWPHTPTRIARTKEKSVRLNL